MDKNKESRNDLVIKLMQEKGKSETQLASLMGKGPGTIYKITGKRSVPSDTTLRLISAALGVDESYWDTGIIIDSESKVNQSNSATPWREEAYVNLKEEKEYFKQKYERAQSKLERIMESLLRGEKPENLNFPRALDHAGAVWMNPGNDTALSRAYVS